MNQEKAGNIIIVIIVIFLNLWLLSGTHQGRSMDYQESQYER